MRPIKFRAWDKRGGQMCEVRGINWLEGLILAAPISTKKAVSYRWCAIEDFELREFTGLHDKNGREIYEGDVVLNRDSGFKGFVIWNQENCCFALDDWHIDWFDSDDRKGYEVIGNIHENPELLK